MRRWVVTGAATAVAVVALALTAGTAPAGKSGGTSATHLDLVVAGLRGSATAQLAERLARRVDSGSNGTLNVSVAYGPDPARSVNEIEDGRVELAIVPSWSLAERGVKSLAALQTPFRITSYEHAALATSAGLAVRLESGLPGLSLTGLALVPVGMERPFGYLKPLLTPADFAGLRIAVDDPSRQTSAVLRALGARPSPSASRTGLDTTVRVGFAAMAGQEQTSTDTFPSSAFTATNVALFPRIDLIVASSPALRRLTGHQRRILRRAAAEARAATVAAGESRQAAGYCAAGGTLVEAPAAALAALRAKSAAVVAALRRDPTTSELITALDAVRPRRALSPRPCAPGRPAQTTPTEQYYDFRTTRRLQPPAGSFRKVVSEEAIRRAGAGVLEARRASGVLTLTFSGPRESRRFTLAWSGPGARPDCRGRTGLNARRVVLLWNPATPCHGFAALAIRRDGHGDILVHVDRRSRPAWIRTGYAGRWKRVDCRPSTVAAESAAKHAQWRRGAEHIRGVDVPVAERRIDAARRLGESGTAELADARATKARLLRLAASLELRARFVPVLGAPRPSDRQRPC